MKFKINSTLLSIISLLLIFLSHYYNIKTCLILSVIILCSGILLFPDEHKLPILFCILPWVEVFKFNHESITLYHFLIFSFPFQSPAAPLFYCLWWSEPKRQYSLYDPKPFAVKTEHYKYFLTPQPDTCRSLGVIHAHYV